MKGLIFTEFLDFVEKQFGIDVCEDMIANCKLTDDGAYTAVGTYDHSELLAMVTQLSESTQTPVDKLVQAFGENLFGVLMAKYPELTERFRDSFTLLSQLESVIHVHVRKLYPDAELPRFEHSQPDAQTLVLDYHSSRGLADVAEGLLRGCLAHYGEDVALSRTDPDGAGGTRARFTLVRAA